MSKLTPNYKLIKPDQEEQYDIDKFHNPNMDTLDKAIKDVSDSVPTHDENENAHEPAFEKHNADLNAHAPLFADVNFYVATNGKDTNNGEQATPFRTIQKAVDSLPASFKGAIINIGTGTFNEVVSVQKKPSGSIIFQGAGIDTTVVNSFFIVLCDYVRIKDLTITTSQDSAVNVQCATFSLINAKLNAKSGGNYGLYTHTVMGLCVGVQINNAKNAIRANYSTINCQQMSGTNNQIGYYAIASLITVESITNIGSVSPIYPATGGAIIDNATGLSLSTGVADSTTAKTDSSKKLVTTEFLNNEVVAESLGANGYRKYKDGLIEMWGMVEIPENSGHIIFNAPVAFSEFLQGVCSFDWPEEYKQDYNCTYSIDNNAGRTSNQLRIGRTYSSNNMLCITHARYSVKCKA